MANKCPFDPSVYVNVPLGMFHCPGCGEMVIAGMAHPDYSEDDSVPNNVCTGLASIAVQDEGGSTDAGQ